MNKALQFFAEKCTGCLQCEMACSFEKTGVFNPAQSRIKVFEFEHGARSFPYTCSQCEPAWCMHACPVDAIVIDHNTGAKVVIEDKCTGCKVCISACPYGTISYVIATQKVMKCDLCGGDPQCASACPTAAIVFAEVVA